RTGVPVSIRQLAPSHRATCDANVTRRLSRVGPPCVMARRPPGSPPMRALLLPGGEIVHADRHVLVLEQQLEPALLLGAEFLLVWIQLLDDPGRVEPVGDDRRVLPDDREAHVPAIGLARVIAREDGL